MSQKFRLTATRRKSTWGTASAKCLALASFAMALSLNSHAESVNLIFAGDIMLDDGPGRLIARGGDPLAPFAAILNAADYRIGNLECPIAESGTALDNKIFSFRAKPQVLPVLQGRFDAVSLANNHSGDYGHPAFLDTMLHLDKAGIAHFGGGRNLGEAHRPLWIERKGLKIAVLAYNEFKPRSFEAGANWPGIAWSEDDHVIADIRAARLAGADLVIPFMHWGWENEGKPSIYSLGNFVFDGFDYAAGQRGWLLRLKLDKSGVIFWDTLAAQMDDDGTPHPVSGTFTPCGRGGEALVSECQNP